MALTFSSVGLFLLAGMAALGASCANPALERPPPPVITVDNELAIQGQVCSSPPSNAVFPVKILFLVDVSGSMVVTDPQHVRVTGVNDVINKYQGLPGVEFAVLAFSSEIIDATNGFTNTPNINNIDSIISRADNLTDDEGVLGVAYSLLTADMLKSTPAERARSKYVIIFFTDGTPDPLCSADKTPCGKQTCQPHNHCEPTTVLNAMNQEVEQYQCTSDYLVCTVAKKNWGSAFSPPVSPKLYPQLMAGANYNTTPQLLASVRQIMDLQKQYHVGSITLNTDFLFPVNALSNPLAAPFGLDRPAGEALLKAMAQTGNGVFQEFTNDTQISFLNVSFASLQVNNTIVQTYVSNQMTQEIGSGLVLDSDGDGLPDTQESSLGTCLALSAKCPTPWDTDGDGYSDFIEEKYRTSGFDPLDPNKPATPCLNKGQDSDGDGLYDCEEEFLKTSPLNPDTDGDYLTDLQEVRHGMDPLNPADAYGDINHDTILNEAEIKMGLSPTQHVVPQEMAFAYGENFVQQPSNGATMGLCYNFSMQHIRLMTPAATPAAPEGLNRIYYDILETAMDSPTNFSTMRRACVDVLYKDGDYKSPLTGTVDFVDSDFVDVREFNPTRDCKDLTKGVPGARPAKGGASDGGGG